MLNKNRKGIAPILGGVGVAVVGIILLVALVMGFSGIVPGDGDGDVVPGAKYEAVCDVDIKIRNRIDSVHCDRGKRCLFGFSIEQLGIFKNTGVLRLYADGNRLDTERYTRWAFTTKQVELKGCTSADSVVIKNYDKEDNLIESVEVELR